MPFGWQDKDSVDGLVILFVLFCLLTRSSLYPFATCLTVIIIFEGSFFFLLAQESSKFRSGEC